VPTIEIVSKNPRARRPAETIGAATGAFPSRLRQALAALQRDQALRVQAEPEQALDDLRLEIVAQADAVQVPIVVSVLSDERGWLVKRADHSDAAEEPTVHAGDATGPHPRGREPETLDELREGE